MIIAMLIGIFTLGLFLCGVSVSIMISLNTLKAKTTHMDLRYEVLIRRLDAIVNILGDIAQKGEDNK